MSSRFMLLCAPFGIFSFFIRHDWRHPDPQAPTDKTTGAKKRYVQLYAFTRAMLYQAHIAQ